MSEARKQLKRISLVILGAIFCGVLFAAHGQISDNGLHLTTRILDQRYCSNINNEDEFDVKLQLELQYKNTGKRPIILDKNSDLIVAYRSANLTNDIDASTFQPLSVTRENKDISESGAKPSSRFVVLKPSQTYLVETYLRMPYSNDWVFKENHILQIVTSTWAGTTKQSEDLKEKWKLTGLLWSADTRSQAMPFAIEQDPQIQECPAETR